ncbi:amine dehydrogenase large subunit [Alloalcanivorax profundimaris]|uniref:amine dehydrogenase large subunit n=1 Tax=Alloalcanivorax profundimaris TaxID=2735259 RepID=UPI001890BEE2|nr:amine dehydrogenase large subunit [Alloalcanivorax profundimaris]
MRLPRPLCKGLLLAAACVAAAGTQAQLPVEKLGQNTTLPFPPDPHRSYIVDFEFNNMVATRVVVVDPDQRKVLGMLSTGGAAPAVLSHDQKTVYTADIFFERYVRGKRTDVITAWDTSSLSPRWEVEIPSKRASTLTERYGLSTSADDRFVYIYNFTPSTSITVVDSKKQEVVNELAIPGCILNYPAGERRFASLCGDGKLQVITLDDNGQEVNRTATRFFDPDEEKLIERAVGNGDTYYFVTTEGHVRGVDLSGKKPKVLPDWWLTTKQERQDGWAPGGWQLMAVAPELNRLYVLMHPDHAPHKWEDPSQTIWVYDLKTRKKVDTMETPSLVWSLNATSDDKPLLLGTNIEGGLDIFDLTKGEYVDTMDGVSKTPTLVINH